MYFAYFLVMLLICLTPIAILLWVGYRLAFPWEVPMPPWLRILFITIAGGLGLSLLIMILVFIDQSTLRAK